MYGLILLISIVLLIIILFSIFPFNIIFSFDSEQFTDFDLKFSWLKRLFNGTIRRDGDKIIFTAYLFNKKILTKNLSANKQNGTNNFRLVKSIKFISIKLQTSYGFEDPSITGIVCGALNIISDYIDLNYSYNNPDFTTDYDYFDINGETKINIIISLFNIIRQKKDSLLMQKLHVSK